MTKIKKDCYETCKRYIYIKGSKVPISYLLDYIKDGYSLTEFLSAYPWVKRENVKKALDQLKDVPCYVS